MRVRIFLLTTTLMAFYGLLMGQGAASLRGSVGDSLSTEAIPFVKVELRRNDSLVGGTLSDEKGKFAIEGLRPGRYVLQLSFMGYRTKRLPPVSLGAGATVDLQQVALSPVMASMSEVQIHDRQDLMLNNIDKKTYSVERNQLGEGGAATDILKNIPSVEVDIDGNLSLRGNGNVTVLIDGKPSSLTGAGRTAILSQIPASSIKSIEVITNPSARFDPDGMGGIINIVTKREKTPGLNGNVSLGIATGNKYNGSLGLNYRNKAISTYLNYSSRWEDRWSEGWSTTVTPDDSVSPRLDQQSEGSRNTYDNVLRGGIDFFLNDKNTLGLSGGGSLARQRSWDLNQFQELSPSDAPWSTYLRTESEATLRSSYDAELNYARRYERQMRSLDARLAYSVGATDEDDTFHTHHFIDLGQSSFLPDDHQLNYLNDGIRLGTLQLDYVDPWNEKNKVETGFKATSRDITNGFVSESYNHSLEQFTSDTLLNNDFDYRERILAGYGIWTHAFTEALGLQVGVRAEQAFTRSELLGDTTAYTRNYFNLFPNSYLYYRKQFRRSGQEFRLSYSRRINRPTTEQLNPFTDYSNPKRLRIGNPQLLPEYIDAFELSWMRRAEWGSVTSSAYFRYISNSHTRFFEPISPGSDTILVTFQNLLDGQNYGVEVIAEAKATKWMDLMVTVNGFRTVMNAGNLEPDLTVDNLGFTGQLTSTFYLDKQTSVQLSANYRSPRFGPQGIFAETFTSDVSIKRSLLKGKGSLNLRVSDVTNTQRFKIISTTDVLEGVTWRKRESRIAYLTFSYRFGKGEFTPKRRRTEERNDSGGGLDF